MTTINKFFRPLGFTAAAIAASSLLFSSAPAQAAQLVTNGDFETGNLSGWTSNGTASVQNIGGNKAVLGAISLNSSSGGISQTLSTVAGTNYVLNYDFYTLGSLTAQFKAILNGNALSTLNPVIFPALPTAYTFNFMGTGSDTISFQASNVFLSPLGVDNVSVTGEKPTAAPEPFTIVGTLIGGSAAMRMRKKLTLSKSSETV
jgi:hypothetical protein